jgi:hypothetical protein
VLNLALARASGAVESLHRVSQIVPCPPPVKEMRGTTRAPVVVYRPYSEIPRTVWLSVTAVWQPFKPHAPIRLIATDRRVSDRFGFFLARSCGVRPHSLERARPHDHDAAYRQLLPNTINNEHPCLVRSRMQSLRTQSQDAVRGHSRFTTRMTLRWATRSGGGRFLPRVELFHDLCAAEPLISQSRVSFRMTARSAPPPASTRVEIVSVLAS